MSKSPIKKIISATFVLIFICAQFLAPLEVNAVALNWDNPNSNKSSPFKFKLSDSMNSDLIMAVIGCTGVVDKVSQAVMDLVQGIIEDKTADYVKTGDKKVTDMAAAEKKRTECLDGIAYTLAKNQLTAMTKSTLNWVATGFSGDPMWVRDTNSFMGDIKDRLVREEVSLFGDDANSNLYPYGKDTAKSLINTTQIERDFHSALRSNMSDFISTVGKDTSNPTPSPSTPPSTPPKPATEKEAISAFNKNFSTGGWNAWLALTTKPENNPIGFQMITSQYLADKQTNEVQNAKDELNQNGGIFNQKKCVERMKKAVPGNVDNGFTQTLEDDPEGECLEYETVTPGSVIKDKISTYVNSPERQLELADSINKSLNAVFSALLNKLQLDGLSSVGSYKGSQDYGNITGYKSNNVYSSNGDLLGRANIGSGFDDQAFDITKDLGNKCDITTPVNDGEWNAQTNKPYITTIDSRLPVSGKKNHYYVVSEGGNTKISSKISSWKNGEIAYFNGTNWQKFEDIYHITNAVVAENGIGIIQLQYDYIVAAQNMIKTLQFITPAIGELDYCIPGPNPNWKNNSQDAVDAYDNYLNKSTVNNVTEDAECGSGWGILQGICNSAVGVAGDVIPIILDIESTLNPGAIGMDQAKDFVKNITTNEKTVGVPPGPLSETTSEYLNLLRKGKQQLGNGDIQDEIKKKGFFTLYGNPNIWTNWGYYFPKLLKDYSTKINRIYGNEEYSTDDKPGNVNQVAGIQKEYIEYENDKSEKILNPAYLPMAETGLNITKNLVAYDESVKELTSEYKNSIVQTNANIKKLKKIKAEIDAIVAKATAKGEQNKRRIERKLPLLEDIPEECIKKKEALKQCADAYVNHDNIPPENNCTDGIDNDRDGFVDRNDPDCFGQIQNNTSSRQQRNPPARTTGPRPAL